ncbi:hypothetical protein HDU97_007644 [Phlyctochytrium planicorne]|nr:hypothetical protein HDU97_007644 [Phlyctochytrium planicorne]
MTTVGGVEAYFAKSETETDRYVILWTDVFGYKNPNARLIADSIAKGGINCLIPDILHGDPVSYENLESLGKKPKTLWQRLGQGLKTMVVAPGFIGWILKHNDALTLPVINAVLDDVKQNRKASKIGVLGYCFGGRYAVLNGGDDPRVDCFVGCHASQVSIPKDIEAVKKPGLFLCADNDHLLTQSQLNTIRTIAQRDGKDITVKVFENTLHGFAIRGNEDDEPTRKARDQATNDTVAFFRAHL